MLSLPTTGPMLLDALKSQDMYLAGSFLMFVAVPDVIGMLVSDLLLAWLDPRIRFGARRTERDDRDRRRPAGAPSTTSTRRRSTPTSPSG